MSAQSDYYVPAKTYWPILLTLSLAVVVIGAADLMNSFDGSPTILFFGLALVITWIFLWFRDVIHESEAGLNSAQMDRTYRWGMSWFIFSEVMFFAAFFGALFYARVFSIEWLGGAGAGAITNEMLWSGFEAIWPTNGPADVGGEFKEMGPWGLPAINTAILLTSGVTVTWAHHALKKDNRGQLKLGLFLTVLLGFIFVFLQAEEYIHAYNDLNLTLESGIYGSTFFMLTGFHGMHVTLGAIMLTVVLFRVLLGHMRPENHFAFEAAAWYWHFVDVVWLGLFVFVYWL